MRPAGENADANRYAPAMRTACFATLALVIVGCDPSTESGDTGIDAFVPASDVPAVDAPRPDVPGLDAPAMACVEGSHSGDATYYTFADGTGACGFATSTDYVAALNMPDWMGSGMCGTCAAIDGPMGSVTVRIVDLCPECASGDLDLSPAAFDQIAERSAGRVAMSWREVPCPVTGPVVFHVDSGANGYYLAVNVRNHRHRLARIERRLEGGSYVDLVRQDYNVWVESPVAGAPVDTMHLRATDAYGHAIEADVPVTPGADVPAGEQFPDC